MTSAPASAVASDSLLPKTPVPASTVAAARPTKSNRPAPSPAPTPSRGTPAAPSAVPACAGRDLAVAVQRGSGTAGEQFADILFTNKGTATCSLAGFPTVQLLVGGRLVGTPAARSTSPARTVKLAPGATAAAALTNDSTCDADNSDAVQVIPPNDTTRFQARLLFRVCAMTVEPISGG
ncbi:MAG: DUF4232 domain-containing protein [Actinomycetia bacterium]|nr:DUF4232 domain-containing protein [Actinomycetes bacterium]